MSRCSAVHAQQAATVASANQDTVNDAVMPLVKKMSVTEKVAQMTQLDIMEILSPDEPFALDEDVARRYARMGIGSFLNSPTAGGPRNGLSNPTSAQWRSVLQKLKDLYVSEGKVPPVFGIDSMHGANYVADAVMLPHAINMAASFSAPLAHAFGRATAQQTRNAGIPWAFAPLFDVAMSPRFPRVYETFGEDPWLVTTMAVAVVQGLQGQPLDLTCVVPPARPPSAEGWLVVNDGDSVTPDSAASTARHEAARAIPDDLSASDVVAACMKHFAGYQASRSGYDRAPAWVPEVSMRAYFLPPFAAAIRAGAATGMVSYNAVDGLPMVISRRWTQAWLRREKGFAGMLVTDWQEIYNQLHWHYSAATGLEAVQQAMLRSSTDMAMVPYKGEFVSELEALVAAGRVPESRLDVAVAAVLALKYRLGLLGGLLPGAPRDLDPQDHQPLPDKLVREHETLSLESAQKGVVLLKNVDDTLPLPLPRGAVLAVVGPNALSRAHLLGGWSVHWQGPSDAEVPGVASVADAFAARGVEVASASGVDVHGDAAGDDAGAAARRATSGVIFVYGEGTYAELGGDVSSSYLPHGQLSLARELRAICDDTGVPLIGVYVGGRDRLLTHFDALFDAHLIAFYPGPYGAAAIAGIVAGDVCPSARLPITLHRDDSQNMPYWRSHSDYTAIPAHITSPRTLVEPLYPFGHGLSYVPFHFSNLTITILPPAQTQNPPSSASSQQEASAAAPDKDGAPSCSSAAAQGSNPGPVPFKPWERVEVAVAVTNAGKRTAATPVLLFVADDARILPPEMRLLKGAQRVDLDPGETATVHFHLNMDDFAFDTTDDIVNKPGRMCQPGTFTLTVEDQSAQVQLLGDPVNEDDWVRLTTYES